MHFPLWENNARAARVSIRAPGSAVPPGSDPDTGPARSTHPRGQGPAGRRLRCPVRTPIGEASDRRPWRVQIGRATEAARGHRTLDSPHEKSLRPGVSFALICQALSPRAQTYCIEQGIDFIDLAGNISINVPGEFTLQRLGTRTNRRTGESASPVFPNVFSGRYSRVLRVLLEKPRAWTLTEISKELAAETDRIAKTFSTPTLQFAISLGAISKILSSLDEQLWVRRQGSSLIVPEPRRLLLEWAEKYKDRYRWRLRSSFETPNSLGSTLAEINSGVQSIVRGPYAFTAAAAASDAPFVDLDRIDIYVLPSRDDLKLRQLDGRPESETPTRLRFLYPYDEGVFLYARTDASLPRVSNIQAYLDLYARGGRDLKQADYLLENVIAARWKAA
jgi:hypothetical protein